MAFVYERVSPQDREWFGKFKIADPFTKEPLYPLYWTIDRDRDALAVGLGGRGGDESDIPMYYALVWNNHIVEIDAYKTGHSNVGPDNKIESATRVWKLTRISAPHDLLHEQEKLMDLIREAFVTEGIGSIKAYPIHVSFDFIAPPAFKKGVDV